MGKIADFIVNHKKLATVAAALASIGITTVSVKVIKESAYEEGLAMGETIGYGKGRTDGYKKGLADGIDVEKKTQAAVKRDMNMINEEINKIDTEKLRDFLEKNRTEIENDLGKDIFDFEG